MTDLFGKFFIGVFLVLCVIVLAPKACAPDPPTSLLVCVGEASVRTIGEAYAREGVSGFERTLSSYLDDDVCTFRNLEATLESANASWRNDHVTLIMMHVVVNGNQTSLYTLVAVTHNRQDMDI